MSQETQTATEVADAGAAPEQISAGGFSSLVPMILIFVVFYFLLIRPQEKKRKAQEQLVSTVKAGENVITHSGIHGKVTKVNENDSTVSLEIAKNVEMKVMKSAIADIVGRKEAAPKNAASKVEKAASANKTSTKKPVPKKTTAKKAKK